MLINALSKVYRTDSDVFQKNISNSRATLCFLVTFFFSLDKDHYFPLFIFFFLFQHPSLFPLSSSSSFLIPFALPLFLYFSFLFILFYAFLFSLSHSFSFSIFLFFSYLQSRSLSAPSFLFSFPLFPFSLSFPLLHSTFAADISRTTEKYINKKIKNMEW